MSFEYIESKTDRVRMQNQWEFDKKVIKFLATFGTITALGYYALSKDTDYDLIDLEKQTNNIEAILVIDDKKKFVNKGVKIKDVDRSDSEKIVKKNYDGFLKNTFRNNRKIQIPIRANEYAKNNNVYKFFPNDRRYVERYTLRDW